MAEEYIIGKGSMVYFCIILSSQKAVIVHLYIKIIAKVIFWKCNVRARKLWYLHKIIYYLDYYI